MYKIILTAPSLCLPGMPPEIVETYRIKVKPTIPVVDRFIHYFCLKYSVELDSILITVKKEEIKPLEL